MIWGWPGALWFFALLGPMVGLFVYRPRAMLAVVPSIVLWEPDLLRAAGSPFGRNLRRLLTLAVESLILVALVLALANPKAPRPEREDLAIIVDCSATMQTREAGGQTRLQEAVAAARTIIDGAPDEAAITIIRCAVFPELLLRGEADKAHAQFVLEQVAPADTDTDPIDALRFARQMKAHARGLRVICLSDFCGIDPGELQNAVGAGDHTEVLLKQVGSGQPNAGIVDIQPAPDGQQLAILIGQSGFLGRDVSVRLTVDDRECARRSVRCEQAITEVQLAAPLRAGDVFAVRLEPEDALPLDNIAWGVWPGSERIRIRLVSDGNLFLEQALRAEPSADLERVSPAEWVHRADVDLTVLDSPSAAGLDGLTGRFLVINPQGQEAESPSLPKEIETTFWAADYAVLRNSDPSTWGALRGLFPPNWPHSRVLAAANDQPVLLEWPDPAEDAARQSAIPSARAVIFDFDLQASDLPLKPAFPVLLWDTIDYLMDRDRARNDVAQPTGTPIREPLQRDDVLRVIGPQGLEGPMMTSAGSAIWYETEHQGIYSVSPEARDHNQPRRIALNWMSMRSAATWSAVGGPQDGPTPPPSRAWMLSESTWRQVLIAALFIAAAEWILFHTRVLRMD